MNKTCKHCGKCLSSNDYRIQVNIRTVMGPILYEQWLQKHFNWEGMNENFYICNDCCREVIKFINNEPCKKIKKRGKEFNCPDCSLNIESCMGCPRYRNMMK